MLLSKTDEVLILQKNCFFLILKELVVKKIIDKVMSVFRYLNKDIWKVDHNQLSGKKKFFVRLLKVILLAVKGFEQDQCSIRSSALTFFTMLAIVPVIAMAFGIAQGFGLESILTVQLNKYFEGQQEVLKYVLAFSHSMLQTTKGGFIAGIGLVLLFWAVLKLLNNIEGAFNVMWEVKRPRSWVRKFTDYLTIIVISPILLILAGSLTVFIKTMLREIMHKNEMLNMVSPYIFSLLKLAPYVIMWVVFSFLYRIMPNTKVEIKSALLAGIIAGSIYQVYQWGYITFQLGAARYNAIYGSFAALPLFLIWLQGSWLIVLLGAELSYAIQNVDKYGIQEKVTHLSNSYKMKLMLLIIHFCVKRFAEGEAPLSSDQISKKLKIPQHFTSRILLELIDCRIISAVRTERDNTFAYQPAQDINRLTIQFVIDSVNNRGNEHVTVDDNADYKSISNLLDRFYQSNCQSKDNILIKEL